MSCVQFCPAQKKRKQQKANDSSAWCCCFDQLWFEVPAGWRLLPPKDGAERQVQMGSRRKGIKPGVLLTSSLGGRASHRRELVSPRQCAKTPLSSLLLPSFFHPSSFLLSRLYCIFHFSSFLFSFMPPSTICSAGFCGVLQHLLVAPSGF